jgi:DNA-binding transcriptional LysR family regulator
MTFDQLEMLEAIVKMGNYKAASEHLHKSQPSLSVGIKKLEEEFSITIFDKSEYRSHLTDQGKIFYQWARESLESFRNLTVIAKEMGDQKTEPLINIVIDPLVEFSFIESIFEACLGAKSATELRIRSEILGKGMELVAAKEAHFAIGPILKSHPEIESFPFQKVEMIPVAVKSIADNHKNFPQIIVSSPDSTGTISKGPKCYVSDHSMKTKLILGGFGWGGLAKYEIEAELKSKKLVPIKDSSVKPVSFDLYVMRNKTKPMGPSAKKIWAGLKKP